MNKNVYELSDRPKDKNIVGNRWVYETKKDIYGNVIKFKARLTAKGFSQKEGIDFDDTYASVSDFVSVRLFLTICLNLNFEYHQIDISTAFLNLDINFDVYMAQPDDVSDGTDRVWKLKKSIYGLKQAAHDWEMTINDFLKKNDIEKIRTDSSLYISKSEGVIILRWVDDFLIAGKELKNVEYIKKLYSLYC